MDSFTNYLLLILVILFIIGVALIPFAIIGRIRKLARLRRSEEIEIGMDEDEMLSIMGGGYTRSLLKGNRVKYEWRINATSSGGYYKGVSSRTYSGVRKVTIYVKDGFVEEVKGYNLY